MYEHMNSLKQMFHRLAWYFIMLRKNMINKLINQYRAFYFKQIKPENFNISQFSMNKNMKFWDPCQ